MNSVLNYIPGFRSKKSWKRVIASLYYIYFIIRLIERPVGAIFFLSIPFIWFALIKNNSSTITEEELLKHTPTHEIRTKIVGVTFDNDDGSSRQKIISKHCHTGQTLKIIHSPMKGYPNAVKVCLNNGKQLGHLSNDLAKDIVDYSKQGYYIFSKVLSVTGGEEGKKTRGCNIIIYLYSSEVIENHI